MKKEIVIAAVVFAALVLSGSTTGESYGPRRRKTRLTRPKEITMAFAGDIMAHDVNYTRRPYSNIYEGIRDILWEADLSFANLEFVFDPVEPASGYPNFNAPVGYVRAAVKGGFNVFSLANNHSLDLERGSVRSTLDAITEMKDDHRIFYNGINATADDYLKTTFFEIHDIRIGFLSVTSFLNRISMEKLINIVPYYDAEAEEMLIRRIEEDSSKVELFIVSYHGGMEYQYTPSESKKELFSRMVDAGADVVWGHHPHVTQPWETFHTRGGEKLVLYSTGNLISGQTWNATPERGAGRREGTGEAALYVVTAEVEDGRSRISRVATVPIFNYQHPANGMMVKRFDRLASMDLSQDWEVYYSDRLDSLSNHLRDVSSWGFER